MSVKQEDAERIYAQRKKEILNAAVVLFDEQGYGRTTMQQIANKAGISKGLVYKYYDSKLDILKNTFVIIQDCNQELRDQESFYDAVYLCAERLVYDSDITSYNPPLRIMITSAIRGELQPEDLQDMERGNVFNARLGVETLGEVVCKAQRKGEVAPGNPEQIANFVWSFIMGLVIQIRYCQNDIDLKTEIRRLCDLLAVSSLPQERNE